MNNGVSFAQVVKTGSSGYNKKIFVEVDSAENGWLYKSAIAKLRVLRSIDSLRESFVGEGVYDIQLRAMGVSRVQVLTKNFEAINRVISLKSKGVIFDVRIMEEQAIMLKCGCYENQRDNRVIENSKQEESSKKEEDEMEDNMAVGG
ncbi:hypothetical protein F0562_012447 [Nyssa sinensis]|uniref:Uncharacterized protein n=1 Tax=Nyssa sinensis TaxID=561372 RepID=A0A5J4ZV57_9ASTE|nr:hypothetical protein F0562_012447 [Nyssa sinensis]